MQFLVNSQTKNIKYHQILVKIVLEGYESSYVICIIYQSGLTGLVVFRFKHVRFKQVFTLPKCLI